MFIPLRTSPVEILLSIKEFERTFDPAFHPKYVIAPLLCEQPKSKGPLIFEALKPPFWTL